jgi:heptosyltransferase-3
MKNSSFIPRTIIISRTDKIGDVVLTLPMAGVLKKMWPGVRIIFLGQAYTKPIVECSKHVDEFWDWREIRAWDKSTASKMCAEKNVDAIVHVFPQREIAAWAKQVGIPIRIGTRNRFYHWLQCNKLVNVSRRNSAEHEASLNLALVKGVFDLPVVNQNSLFEYYGLSPKHALENRHATLLDKERVNVILHPKSKGSAREWPLHKWKALAESLPPEKFKIFVSGGPEEALELISVFPQEAHCAVVNIAGTMSLEQFVSFVGASDGLVAASTGPLHIASSLGRHALGLYPPIKPMHGGRWGPLGARARFLSVEKNCEACRHSGTCACMEAIPVDDVRKHVIAHFSKVL